MLFHVLQILAYSVTVSQPNPCNFGVEKSSVDGVDSVKEKQIKRCMTGLLHAGM